MTISSYHIKQSNHSEEETDRRILAKELELEKIFSKTSYKPGFDQVRVAVLGCADKRFVKRHKSIFEKLLQKPVELITFDIEVEHLEGEEGVVQHDITTPLPHPPFDVVFGHVVLKFIETSKQFDVIKHTHDALRSPGLGIFAYNTEDVTTEAPILPDGYYSVPLETWKQKLAQENIKFTDIKWEISLDDGSGNSFKGGALVILR